MLHTVTRITGSFINLSLQSIKLRDERAARFSPSPADISLCCRWIDAICQTCYSLACNCDGDMMAAHDTNKHCPENKHLSLAADTASTSW